MAFGRSRLQSPSRRDIDIRDCLQKLLGFFKTLFFLFTILLKTSEADFSIDVPTMLELRDALDPYNISINTLWTGSHNCTDWEGVTCSDISGRVTEIRLAEFQLEGFIPAIIQNLSYLEMLDLNSNSLSGSIPDSIGKLSNLQYLDLSFNSLSGSIPTSIGNLSNLIELHLRDNSLPGSIPDSIGNLSNLKILTLSFNSLSGSIPESISNLFDLQYLESRSNSLSGSIPDSIGNLTYLKFLDLSENSLSGSIPYSIENLTYLQYLYVSYNSLSGSIPNFIGNLSYLEHLNLDSNLLSGSIPDSIRNLTFLTDLILGSNPLSGSIPDFIGNLSYLIELNLGSSSLSGSIPDSIGSLSNLKFLHLSSNSLSGPIPDSIGNLSNLLNLDLSSNSLSGSIPDSICNLIDLESLDLSSNSLRGSIPDSIGNLSHLGYLDLSSNSLSGSIPDSIGNLTYLQYLYLSSNSMSGSIPYSIGNLSLLTNLIIHSNHLSGVIPNTFYSLKGLQKLQLNGNELSGSISQNIQKFQDLSVLSMQENQLSGTIPMEVGNMSNLNVFDVSSNYFTNGVPHFNMNSFFILDFSRNCLNPKVNSSQRNTTECETFCHATQPMGPCGGKGTCHVPYLGSIAECKCLEGYSLFFDPYNCITQSPPAPPPPSPPPPSFHSTIPVLVLAVIIIIPGVAMILTGILLWCLVSHCAPRLNSFDERLRGNFTKSIPLRVLSAATNNFSEDNLIGIGDFGKVYKGVSPDGNVWAIKRATHVALENAVEFHHEINVISKIFHGSILPLKGYCNENGELILVYAFMANGSLKDFMHNNKSSVAPLTFEQRMSIAIRVAEGLHYLHHQARPAVIHRNVKSENILLDENFNAHVADFVFLKVNSVGGTLQLVGSPGYIDPEYVRTYNATAKSDVYSFGVVLLELITGLPAVFTEEEGDLPLNDTKISLVRYVHEKVHWDVSRMMDPKLNGQFDATAARDLIALAEKCLSKFGDNRPSMQDVCASLVNINSSIGDKEMDVIVKEDRVEEHISVQVTDEMGLAQTFVIPSMPESFMRLK